MANRLGIVDPDELADRMTPEMLDERIAHYRIEPWGDEWLIGGMIASEVANGILRAIYARGGKQPNRDDLSKITDFIPQPPWLREQQQERRYLSDQELAQELNKLI